MAVIVGEARRSVPAASAILLAFMLALGGCERQNWKGWVYPDQSDLTRSIEIGPHESLEQCREQALAALRSMPVPSRGDYECGRACRFDESMRINVCAETVR